MSPTRFPFVASAPLTAVVSMALVATSLTALAVRGVASAPEAQAANQLTQQVGFNGRAWTVTQPDPAGVRYIGGEFTSFNAWNTGKGAWVDPASGVVDPTFRSVGASAEGGVHASVPDGSGGLFVAGGVTALGSAGRNKIVRVLADGSADPTFVPPIINDEVWAIAFDGSVLYVGGKFTSVGGQARNYVAALDGATGALLPWNPSASNWVMSLHVDGLTVYLGGRFTTVDGIARNLAAAVRTGARTGGSGTCLDSYDSADCLTTFAPPITGGYGVFEFAKNGGDMYVGGDLSATASGTTITSLIRVDASTGALDTSWDPAINVTVPGLGPRVYDMDIEGTTLYVGGRFGTAGGATRTRVAAFDLANGGTLVPGWAPVIGLAGNYGYNGNIELHDAVSAIEVSGGSVYMGGGIFAINGEARNRVGAVDAVTGATRAFDPHACDGSNGAASHVRTITAYGSKVFIGGNFDCMGGLKRYFAAAVNPDGVLTDWNPQVNAAVNAMSSDGTTVYMVGRFTAVNDQPRRFAAAVQTDETLTAWDPSLANPSINAWSGACGGGENQTVLQAASAVYIGGCFTLVGGVSRVGVAKTDRVTGAVDTNFNANVGSANVRSLAISGSRLYIGGLFTSVGGQPRDWIAAVDKDSGALDTGWNAGAIVSAQDASVRQAVRAIEPSTDDTRLYIGGWFGTINGQTQRFLAALDKETGALDTSWRPVVGAGSTGGFSLDFGIFAIDQYDDSVFVAGAAGNPVAGTAFGVVSAVDASVSTWMNRSFTSEVRGISVNDASAFIAGGFSSVAGTPRMNTAAIDLRGPVLDPWPMDSAKVAPLAVSISAPDATTSGAVVSNPGGINCGGTCEYAFPTTQTVTLQAVPKPAADFAGWTGACSGFATTCTVSMSSARSAVASFAPLGSVVTPSPTPSASASATPTPSASATPAPSASSTPTAGPGPVPQPGDPADPRAPGPPVGVSARMVGTAAVVEWNPPLDPGSAPVTSYRVVASPGGSTCVTTTTSCTVDGLEPGTAYTFTVAALNSVAWGSPSEESSVVIAPLIRIQAGKRMAEGRKDRIVVTGTAVGLPPGTALTPFVKMGSQRAEAVGRARVVVRADGEITWRRLVRPFRVVSVHLRADGVRSNSVSWQRIR